MKLESARKHRRHSRLVEGIFSKNPVLFCGLALPFAVMITTNLKNSVSISILLACSLIPTVLLASMIGRLIPKWAAVMLYTVLSMVIIIAAVPVIRPISPEVSDSLGIYVPILAINTILTTLCFRCWEQPECHPIMALVDAVTYSLGFALAVCAVAAVRELLGNNALWGVPIAFPVKLGGMQIAFSGFLTVALLSALARFLRRSLHLFIYRRSNPKYESLPQ